MTTDDGEELADEVMRRKHGQPPRPPARSYTPPLRSGAGLYLSDLEPSDGDDLAREIIRRQRHEDGRVSESGELGSGWPR